MRLGILCLGVLAMTAAHAQRNKDDDTEAAKRACSVEECFYAHDIRDFEVIDQRHLIVYTGSQRCAFHVELSGTMCDMTFAPELFFTRQGDVPVDSGITQVEEPDAVPGRNRGDPFGALETARRNDRHLRICDNDLAIAVHGGRYTESNMSSATTLDRFGNPKLDPDCKVYAVTSITDDQLVEFYVGRGVVPPLPPMGTGDIEVGDPDEARSEDAAPPPDAPKSRGRAKK